METNEKPVITREPPEPRYEVRAAGTEGTRSALWFITAEGYETLVYEDPIGSPTNLRLLSGLAVFALRLQVHVRETEMQRRVAEEETERRVEEAKRRL